MTDSAESWKATGFGGGGVFDEDDEWVPQLSVSAHGVEMTMTIEQVAWLAVKARQLDPVAWLDAVYRLEREEARG